jgi:hypothetical protein
VALTIPLSSKLLRAQMRALDRSFVIPVYDGARRFDLIELVLRMRSRRTWHRPNIGTN